MLRRNCFLKHVTEGKIEGKTEVRVRRRRRRKQLLNDFKEKRTCWELKEEREDRYFCPVTFLLLYKPDMAT